MASGRSTRLSASLVAALVVLSGVAVAAPGSGVATGPAAVGTGSASGATDAASIGSATAPGRSAAGSGESTRLGAPRQPRLVTAEASPNGTLNLSAGESATVTFELTAERTLTDVRLTATSPLGLTVDSPNRTIDRVEAGGTISYAVDVTAERAVERTLAVVVSAGNGSAVQYVAATVDATAGDGSSAVVSDESTPAVGQSTTTSATAAAPSSVATVSGQAAYTDPRRRMYGLSGVTVRIYDVDGSSLLLDEGTTADNGSFAFSIDTADDSDGDGEIVARVVIVAENDAVYVTDGSDTYSYSAETGTLTGGENVTLGVDEDNDLEKELIPAGDNAPYQAVDWAKEAHDFAAANGVEKTKLPIIYPIGDWAYYSFRGSDEQIELPDRSEYWWDRSTVAHEYGHAVHFQLNGYRSLDKGYYSCHTFPSETDPAYALVEGFAEYYAAATLDDPEFGRSTWNLENDTFYDYQYDGRCANGDASGEYDGLSVEGSVASILWDITDGGPNDDDAISYSFAAVAEMLASNPTDINEFYDRWDRGDRDALDRIYAAHGIDKLPPAIEPTLRSTPYTDASVVLNGSVLDGESGTDRLDLAVDGGSYTTVATGDGNWSATRELADGNHTVSIRATDVNGNSRAVTRTIRVSSTPPTLETAEGRVSEFGSPGGTVSVGFDYGMRYPTAATVRVLDGGTAVATASVTDLDPAPSGGSGSVAVRLPANVSDGSYDVELTVTDASNRTNTTRIDDALLVDTTTPAVDSVTLADAYVNASTPLSFTVVAADDGSVAAGVERIEVRAVPSGPTTALSNADGNWTGTVAPGATDGNHTAVVRVIDSAGNVNRTEIAYEVDTAAPTLTAAAPRFTNASEATVTGTVSDANLSSLTVRAPNGTERRLSGPGSYTATVALANGSNTVVVVATDAAGNTASRELSVGVDRIPPTANLSSPGRVGAAAGPPATNDSDPSLTFDVTDDLAGIGNATTATVDDAAAPVTVSGANGTVTVTGADLDDGSHTVAVRLVDRAGNVDAVEETFVVDTVAPTVENVTLPDVGNRTVDPLDDVTVAVNASDDRAGVDAVYGQDRALVNRSGTWRGNATAPIRVGNRSIELRVVDAAGNGNRTTVPVYVGTRQPATVDGSGVATAEPPAPEVDSVAVTLAGGANASANATVELTSAVTDANPVDDAVPADHVPYYTQFVVESANATDGGSFVLRVSRDELNASAALEDSLTFWVHNGTAGEWTALNATRLSATDGSLSYRVETPHYSTFAVGADVDDASPWLDLIAPTADGEIEAGDRELRATFGDNESRVLPDGTRVTVDGTPRNVSNASLLNGTRLRMGLSLDAGNHTVSVRVVDRFGNARTVTRDLTVVEPDPPATGGGAGAGGGGGGERSSEPARTSLTAFADSTTVSVSDVSHGAEFDVALDSAAGGGVRVESLGFAFTFDSRDFRVELDHPRDTLDDVPGVDSGVPLGYVDLVAPGLETDSLDSASITLSVSEDRLPAGTTPADVRAYQYVDGEWQPREVTAGGGTYEVRIEAFAPIAVVAEPPATATATPTGSGGAPATETPTPTATPAPTPSATPTATPAVTAERTPGFGVVVALVALLLGVLLRRRQEDR